MILKAAVFKRYSGFFVVIS